MSLNSWERPGEENMESRTSRAGGDLQRERQIQRFASNPQNIEKLTRTVEAAMANYFRDWARSVGIRGHAFNEWLEDMVAEGMCLAWANLDKWDPERSPDWNWVFLHAKSFASRWLKKLIREREAIEHFAEKLYPIHNSDPLLRGVDYSWVTDKDSGLAIEALLSAELSVTHQNMLNGLLEGFTVREIASREGYSVETTQRYISRAQERARKVRHLYDLDGQKDSDLPRPREPSPQCPSKFGTTPKTRRPSR